MLCQLLNNLGDINIKMNNLNEAKKYYIDSIDGLFGTYDIIHNYNTYLEENDVIITLGYKNIIIGCLVLYKLFKYSQNSNDKLTYAIFISRLIKELFTIVYPHPQRYCDFNNYLIDEVWNEKNIFENIEILPPSLVCDMLYFISIYLYDYQYYLSCFPILSYGIYITSKLCRNPVYTTMFRIILCKCQCKESYYNNSIITYYNIINVFFIIK